MPWGRKVMVVDMGNGKKAHGIRKKENFERELSTFFREAASVNHVFAGTSFLMQFFSFYEGMADGERSLCGETLSIWREICRIAKDNFLGEFDADLREKSVLTLSGLRGTVTRKMEVLTAYTDRFSLYEYILNRVEPRFEEEIILPEDDEAAREILRYIFMEKDNLLVNTRIQQMLSQLPVRMGRGKFEDLVRGGFENYNGMDTGAVDDFVYRILSVAGLYEPEGMGEYFPEFTHSLGILKETDLKQVQKEEYKEAQELFTRTAEAVRVLTDDYYSLMELINLLFAWLLNYPYADKDAVGETQELTPLLKELCEKGLAKREAEKFAAVSGECAALLQKTEGVLEEFTPKLQKAQAALSKFTGKEQESVQAMMLGQEYACLKTSVLLVGGSLFADLSEGGEPKTADRSYLKQAADSLMEKLLAAFSAQPAIMNRAMIAAVLGELPVFFGSQNEVMDYVRTSLAGCHEKAEKAAGIRLMRKLMEE
ncbi:MAG: hypothetical protein K2N63_01800 [Lachnospiraceae bacterium]|nr:hypothetical protein [Lachnospiraceae bacterium]